MTGRIAILLTMGLFMLQAAHAESANPCNPCSADNPCAVEDVPANPCDAEATEEAEPAPAGPVYDPDQPINDQFAQLRLAFMASLPEEMQEFFLDQSARLSAQDIPGMAIQQGEQAPELMMAQPGEESLEFSEFVAQGPIILQFYRGNW